MYGAGASYLVEGDVRYTLITSETTESSLNGDLVYFSPHCGVHSYAVYLDRSYGMSEEDISNFVRSKDPELFDKYLSPAHLAPVQNFHPQQGGHQYASFAASSAPTYPEFITAYALPVPSHALAARPGLWQAGQSDDSYQQALLLLQWKRHIVSSLLNGALFILAKISSTGSAYSCSLPLCAFEVSATDTAYILTMRSVAVTSCVQSLPNNASFCLTCLEDLFASTGARANRQKKPNIVSQFDGICEDGLVTAAAERLMAHWNKDAGDIPGLPFNYPSNSPQAMYLRRQKNIEIEDILKQFERAEKRSATSSSKVSPTLVILPPADMPPPQDRYKKQGLGPYDQRKQSEKRVLFKEYKSGVAGEHLHSIVLPGATEPLICYCREPEDDEDIIKCSSEFCVVGWIHVRCSGLSQLPRAGSSWFCKFCSETSRYSSCAEDDDSSEDSSTCDVDQDPMAEKDEHEFYEEEKSISRESLTGCEYSTNHNDQDEKGVSSTPRTPDWMFLNRGGPRTSPLNFLDGPSFSGRSQKNSPLTSQYATLPAGHTKTVFADLAPFIFADQVSLSGLSQSLPLQSMLISYHIAALEQWKVLCPPSKLLHPPPSSGPSTMGRAAFNSPTRAKRTVSESVVGDSGGNQQPPFTKLSTVLADVDRQFFAAGVDMEVAAAGDVRSRIKVGGNNGKANRKRSLKGSKEEQVRVEEDVAVKMTR